MPNKASKQISQEVLSEIQQHSPVISLGLKGNMRGFAGDIHLCQALIIDSNPTSRSILSGMLQDLGMRTVTQTAKLSDARRLLENRTFDIVLCDYHFDDSEISGQDLLEDLRRTQILPFSTVFIMITGEASYAKVAEAAESALDSYLLKPHNSYTLAERIQVARQRKKVFKPIFQAIEEERFEEAAHLCITRFEKRAEYWLYAARIGAELLLRLGNHDQARELFDAIHKVKALPWAKLGIARSHIESNRADLAKHTLDQLISEYPSYADAFDVLGRAQLEQGNFIGAFETYYKAVELTPSSILRLQKAGMMAFYLGKTDIAIKVLEKATTIGIASKMYDCQSIVMLALLRFEKKDTKGVQRCLDNVEHIYSKSEDNKRIYQLVQITRVLQALQYRQTAEASEVVKQLAATIMHPTYDFEAACNLISLLARLKNSELELTDTEIWLQKIADRFCISRVASELLILAANGISEYEEKIRLSYNKITNLAEQAMTYALANNPSAAAKLLFMQSAKLYNSKLLDLANMVLHRYKDQIPECQPLTEMVNELRQTYCTASIHINLGKNMGRSAGSIKLDR